MTEEIENVCSCYFKIIGCPFSANREKVLHKLNPMNKTGQIHELNFLFNKDRFTGMVTLQCLSSFKKQVLGLNKTYLSKRYL